MLRNIVGPSGCGHTTPSADGVKKTLGP